MLPATIADFNPAQDKIQLQGSASDYSLEGASLYSGKAIESRKLIASFRNNVTGLDLTSSAFQYVNINSDIAKDINFGNQKLNQLPTLTNISKSGNEDAKITFTSNDFTTAFSDADGNSLTKIKISSLPTNGTFQLNGVGVTLDQEIPVSELDKLVFTPDLNFSGNLNFTWNGFDGTD
jgi:Bacterial cadherin-like domain